MPTSIYSLNVEIIKWIHQNKKITIREFLQYTVLYLAFFWILLNGWISSFLWKILKVLFITGYDVPCNMVSRYFSDLLNFYLYLIFHILEFSFFFLDLEIFTFYVYCFTPYEVSLYCSNLLLKHFFFSFLFFAFGLFLWFRTKNSSWASNAAF